MNHKGKVSLGVRPNLQLLFSYCTPRSSSGGQGRRVREEFSLHRWATVGLTLPAPVIWVRVFVLTAAVQSLLLLSTSKPGLSFPTHVFYLVLATFEDWYWMALGSDPTNWQSWPQGMNKTLAGINITLIMVQWALFCALLDNPEQFLWINDWAAAGRGLPPGFPGALFSIHMGTTFHTCFKVEFCYAQHI